MKLQQMKQGQYFISLPSSIVKAKGWTQGDNLTIEINQRGEIIIKKTILDEV